jgi:hypothetical protein
MSVPGARWINYTEELPRIAHPPGLDGPKIPYRTVFFGAQREYTNDEEGWQTYPYHSLRVVKRKARRARRVAAGGWVGRTPENSA